MVNTALRAHFSSKGGARLANSAALLNLRRSLFANKGKQSSCTR